MTFFLCHEPSTYSCYITEIYRNMVGNYNTCLRTNTDFEHTFHNKSLTIHTTFPKVLSSFPQGVKLLMQWLPVSAMMISPAELAHTPMGKCRSPEHWNRYLPFNLDSEK